MNQTEQEKRCIEIAKMVAESYQVLEPNLYFKISHKNDSQYDYYFDYELHFYNDSWLMPVVRWIAGFICPDEWDKSTYILFRMNVISLPNYAGTIELFIVVSDFAKWYNNQKNQNHDTTIKPTGRNEV